MLGRRSRRVKINEEQRKFLESIIRKGTSPQREVMRAQIILMAADGESNKSISQIMGISLPVISKWRNRASVLKNKEVINLKDAFRKGRPQEISNTTRLEIISVACEPYQTSGRRTPTIDEIHRRIIDRSVVKKISRAHVHRILQAGDIRPHKVRMWLHSPDPRFKERVNDICNLYHNPPANSVVLCIDEKTGMQAIERAYEDHNPKPGQPRRQDFEYIRHGTQSLIAAYNVHSGSVIGHCGDTRTGEDLKIFMEAVAKAYPHIHVHVVWDNLNIHLGLKKRWETDKKYKRFHFHFTPLHASWVNQVELWFGILGKRCLRNASFKNKTKLRSAILNYIALWEEKFRKPFSWTFRGYPLQSNIFG